MAPIPLLAAAAAMALIQPTAAFSLSAGGLRLSSPAAQISFPAARGRRAVHTAPLSLRASSEGSDGVGEAEDARTKYASLPPLQPGETREENGMVQITEVELLELAERAGFAPPTYTTPHVA